MTDPDRIVAIACWLGALGFAAAAARHSYQIWRDR